ncbi:MAG TPA: FG-GAP-like repeat-containing protein [Terriglobales bacterium]|nr:FG-GAP-like repeat-containing protein [Terriglobales bacterium]
MTCKLTRNHSVLRGIAPFIAVLTVLIALATLAQTRGAGRAFGKSDVAPVRGSTVPSDAGSLNSGTPLFLPAVTYDSGGYLAESVAVRDLNGDGKPDLLVGNLYSSRFNCCLGGVSVLLGVGDGTFRKVGFYGTAGIGASVAIADVNGDGKPDMLAAGCDYTCSNGVVTVHTGNGDGTFANGTVFGTGGFGPSAPAVADLNGDGKRDLVVANCGEGCTFGMGTVGVLLGNGDATFQTAVTYGTGGVGADSVKVADVNSDGKPDLLVANLDSSTVGVLLGSGDGTFQTAVTYGSGGYFAESIAVADVNGDGKLDVLVANSCGDTACSLPGTVGVMLGNGDGTFQAAVPYSSGGQQPRGIAVADVNRDGRRDLVVTTFNNNVLVLLGNGNGTFQAPVAYGTGGSGVAGSLAIADVNGDGRPDVMVVNECFNTTSPNCPHGSVGVLLNDTGPHRPTTTSLVSNVNPAAISQPVIYTATVTNQSGRPLTGTVVFKPGRSVPLVGDQAIYKITYSHSGTNLITATYSGDADNATSTSATLTEYVGLVPTKTILTTSGSPSLVGHPVTFTATVTWTYGTVPDGELVTFFDGTTAIGTGATMSGVAKFTTSSLTVGTHTIKAPYAGDVNFKPSTGIATQVVNK